jgi:hypothetical protein
MKFNEEVMQTRGNVARKLYPKERGQGQGFSHQTAFTALTNFLDIYYFHANKATSFLPARNGQNGLSGQQNPPPCDIKSSPLDLVENHRNL